MQMIKQFQAELSYLSQSIIKRNALLTLPYNYLNPAEMENSVSIWLSLGPFKLLQFT
jgi:hypothetical protein